MSAKDILKMVQAQVSLDQNHQRLHQIILTVSSIICNEHHIAKKLGMKSKYESWTRRAAIVLNGPTQHMTADRIERYHMEQDTKRCLAEVYIHPM